MDLLWGCHSAGHSQETCIAEAMRAFEEVWTSNGYPLDDGSGLVSSYEGLEPRTPSVALEMFYGYYDRRNEFMSKAELLSVERPFIVPLDTEGKIFYIGKLDKTIRYEGKFAVVEHKTTTLYSKVEGIQPRYLESFSPNSQVDGYIFALKMLYGDQASYVFADIALVHKNWHDIFALQPMRKNDALLGEFVEDVHYWVSQIASAAASTYWPKNTKSCFDYNSTCPYASLCRGLNFDDIKARYAEEPPPGYKIEIWNPVEELHLSLEDFAAKPSE
jgi:hypothetical protein